MRNNTSSEFLYQLFALILALILVHSFYVTLIRPNANAILQEQLAREAAGEAYVAERSFYIVVKDYEQEACFILMLWAFAIMGYKARRTLNERKLLSLQLLGVSEGSRVLPEDARQMSRPVQALPEAQRAIWSPGRCWRHCSASVPRAISRTFPALWATYWIPNPTDSTRNYPWFAISPGRFHPSVLSARFAVSERPSVRHTRRWKAILPVSRPVLG